MKKGFTLVEVLVGGLILVIAMALIAVLYGKASKIRTIVTGESDIQAVANQMMDTIISGGGNPLKGLRCATRIYAASPEYIIFGNIAGPEVKFEIDSTNKTVKKKIPRDGSTSNSNLDFNDKVDIDCTKSRFFCYNANDTTETDTGLIAKIMICLAARSSLSAISRTIILYNSVTIRNIYHID